MTDFSSSLVKKKNIDKSSNIMQDMTMGITENTRKLQQKVLIKNGLSIRRNMTKLDIMSRKAETITIVKGEPCHVTIGREATDFRIASYD